MDDRRVVRFGVFEVDLRAGELRKLGMKIRLQQQPFRVLALLLEHAGDVVTREELRQAIWPAGTFVEFNLGVDAAIHRLRSALDDSAESPRFVETLPRRGYRFIAPVEEVLASIATAAPPPPPQTVPVRKNWRLTWIVGLAAVVVLALALASATVRDRVLGRAAAPRIHSLALLPFDNLSGDSAQAYFADGMTEALVTRLGQTEGLRVISHTSVMHYKGTRKTLPEIAQELNVDAVVEGAVLRAGNRVRVTAQLVEASTDQHLWAQTYERDPQDVLSLQDEIAGAIANEVQIRLSASRSSPLPRTRARPVNPEAYELYLRGRAEWNGRTEQGLRRSIEYYQQAIEKDSSYAAAWAGLSDAYASLGQFNFLPRTVTLPKAKAAALRAIQLDEALSEAHIALAYVLLHLDWSWSGSDRESRRAIALNPSNDWAHQSYGHTLAARGQFDAAISEMQRALELDPLSPSKENTLAATLYRAGRYDEALQRFLQVPDPDANSEYRHRRMAAIYERKGRLKEAVAEWLTALRLGGKEEVARSVEREYRASGYAAAKTMYLWGDLRDAERRAQGPYPRPNAFDIAADYAQLGDQDKAFQWLERSFREREGILMFLMVDDRLEALRSDPRFRDLALRVGLGD